jgi:hypothetical protein
MLFLQFHLISNWLTALLIYFVDLHHFLIVARKHIPKLCLGDANLGEPSHIDFFQVNWMILVELNDIIHIF